MSNGVKETALRRLAITTGIIDIFRFFGDRNEKRSLHTKKLLEEKLVNSDRYL
ncbi:hypothetical protein GNF10_10145 [Nostoc sp. UCD121]|uniref:hypothetical protein n=1 Tax=unclassified Nostoc TaxID=2593658 RepID=UPI001629C262|nr:MULTISPECIES: hypothetical protein [unclassified Nostoc]MBC1224279.1 hypothetical protein [Nostoc sp. UCD120]MBC1276341.1 hypothetical protein [Nostoc sp. UCD121]MBC1297511.1 hypothetical protein [Nostoc sp. UCD122]